ncbi:hypothetical protein HYW75_07185 [Candidatus Pacearchaeota archaeon]|nr:hypothetical protein [Candidatus Pacearchaeota archaeon]
MAVNIHNLIAAINPDIFCDPSARNEVKKLIKEKPDYLKAAEKAKPVESKHMDFDIANRKSAFDLEGIKNPIEQHSLEYDSSGENLEPVYFWILDNLKKEYEDMKNVFKLVDNFIASPGSGLFSEMGAKATRMQEEAMKILGSANQVVKSVINILYDLKEFKLRLDLYIKLKSNSPGERNAALYSLKQIWMDTVDVKRSTTSLKGLVQQLNYVTIIDAFMSVNTPKDMEKVDLNERVKRILEQRVSEFFSWLDLSEKELSKRYEVEKLYLKSQVSAAKLYARWAKPYLRAARSLEQNATPTAALVTSFNTALFELILLGESEYKSNDDVKKGDLPVMFNDLEAKKKIRLYSPIIIVELKFRSVPERAGQGYGFRGKLEAVFTSYALNDKEIKILKEEIERDDIGDALKLIEGTTTESLDQLQEEIDEYINDKEKKEEEKKKENDEDTNPFSALFSFFKSNPEGKKDDNNKSIPPDSNYEKVVRSRSIIKAREECRKFYNLYKRVHNMPAFSG